MAVCWEEIKINDFYKEVNQITLRCVIQYEKSHSIIFFRIIFLFQYFSVDERLTDTYFVKQTFHVAFEDEKVRFLFVAEIVIFTIF